MTTPEEWARRLTLQSPPPAVVVGTIRAAVKQAGEEARAEALREALALFDENTNYDLARRKLRKLAFAVTP